MERDKSRYKSLTRRTLVMAGGQIGLFGALAGRMYYLQVVEADRYRLMADANRVNVQLLAPQRGRILDRFGIPMAVNRQNYRLVVVAEQAADIPSTLDAIALLIPLGPGEKRKVMLDIGRKHPFVPVVVKDNLSWEQVARLEVNLVELPGVAIEQGSNRAYPFADRVSHVVGYVAPVAPDELSGDPLLELPDFQIGKSGIEKAQDLTLRGAAGTSEVEVNALGRVVREISRDDGEPGQEVVLTIDMGLQDFAMRQLAQQQSATMVVMDATSGEVLVMASSPAYDDNSFTNGLSQSLWQSLISDPHTPLNNKAIQGLYPPGSTFKPTVALAALEAGVITPDFTVTCNGKITFGSTEFHCWWKPGHGTLDLHGGIKHSCDIYFYEVARRLGVDRIAEMAKRLGFAQPTGIDIPNESAGLIPTRAWKLATYGVPWQDGETLSVGIGQGYVSVTPLQLCTVLARLVTNTQVVPHLVRAAGVLAHAAPPPADATAAPAEPMAPAPALGFQADHLAAVLSGMSAVVNEPGGTAYAARIMDPALAMGGKSGTAQVRHISLEERLHGLRKPEDLPWKQRDHALFIAFAPVDQPRYVCSIVIEHGIGGSKYAAPLARDMLTECQKRDPARQRPKSLAIPIAAAVAAGLVPAGASPDAEEIAD
jgi:penicillin-binding protein 2